MTLPEMIFFYAPSRAVKQKCVREDGELGVAICSSSTAPPFDAAVAAACEKNGSSLSDISPICDTACKVICGKGAVHSHDGECEDGVSGAGTCEKGDVGDRLLSSSVSFHHAESSSPASILVADSCAKALLLRRRPVFQLGPRLAKRFCVGDVRP
jgi:hypothetical protein